MPSAPRVAPARAAAASSHRTGLAVLFSATSFAGAGLLFVVQPMVAKRLLPLYGGSPAVWNTANVFFQLSLLAGYFATHTLVSRFGVRRHAAVQVGIALLPLLALPIGISSHTDPGTRAPVLSLLLLLVAAVGGPFLLLSTAGPMLQRWFAATSHPRAHDPYFLFAAGNVGSLVGLLGYPVLVEPHLGLSTQQRWWSWGYVVWVALIAACALAVRRSDVPPEHHRSAHHGAKRELTWIVLAALTASLLLGTTTYITTDLAPVPLLWVVPLALYLLSFVIAFALTPGKAAVWARRLGRALPWVLLPTVIVGGSGLWVQTGLVLLVLALVACAAHMKLSADRPAVEGMTRFYLLVATGGALGGAINGLVGPVLLNRLYEYPAGLATALALLVPMRKPTSFLTTRYGVLGSAVVAAAVIGAAVGSLFAFNAPGLPRTVGLVGAALLGALLAKSPRSLAVGMALVLLGPMVVTPTLTARRSFFGVQTVEASGALHLLTHGTTIHGAQDLRPGEQGIPRGYYGLGSPIGQILLARPGIRDLGVVGLGSGTLAAYGHPGEEIRFFEIDPDSISIARNPHLFTYLSDSRAHVDVVAGDGRLSLAKESPASFDVLVLDAFSSDAVPVHLLTREALRLYLSRLRPGGVIAFHVTNRYLDLRPVLADVAAADGVTGLWQKDPGDKAATSYASTWVVIAPEPSALAGLATDPRWHPLSGLRTSHHPWTDEWSNVLQALSA